MNQSKNSYFVNDSQIADMSRRVVENFFKNDKIAKYKHNGRKLTGNIGILVNRPISSIYSNIEGHIPLNVILLNAIHFSIFTNPNATQEAEFKPIREATERKKNQLAFLERKKKKNEEAGGEDELTQLEIEKTQMEIQVLEEKLSQIASAAGPPIVNSAILNLAKRVYEILLRADRTSQNLYVEICRNLGITVNIYERFFDKSIDDQKLEKSRQQSQEQYRPPRTPFKQEKGTYVPPALQGYQGYQGRRGYERSDRQYGSPFSHNRTRSYTPNRGAAAADESDIIPPSQEKFNINSFPDLVDTTQKEPKKEIKQEQVKSKSKSMYSLLEVDEDNDEEEPVQKVTKTLTKKPTLGVWENVSAAVKAVQPKEEHDEDIEEEKEKPRMVILGKIKKH
jgi:hypothetical protein